MRASLVVLALSFAAGCAHAPETTLHLHAPDASRWAVHDGDGKRLCTLPCTVGLDRDQSVVVGREGGGAAFTVRQGMIGAGDFDASIRARREPSAGAIAFGVVSNALLGAGVALAHARDEQRSSTGALIAVFGAVGVLASSAWDGGTVREELWVQRSGTAQPADEER
jgi:hypothetical protein